MRSVKRANAIAIALTPALSFGTLAIALGVGARGETLAAIVYGAPPSADHNGIAWQVDVLYEDRGVREIKPNLPITVHAAWNGNARDWSGATTHEGAAEVPLDFSGIASGDDVDLTITTNDDEKKVLASGRAHVPNAVTGRGNISHGGLSPLHHDGNISIDVVILGGALAAEFPSELWVRAQDQQLHSQPPGDVRNTHILVGAHAHLDAVDGLTIAANDVVTCDDGWAKFEITARALAVNATIRLKSGALSGSWNGALPIVLGATRALVTQDDAGNLHALINRPLMTSSNAYVEINDDVGRVFAAAVPLIPTENEFAHASIDLPKLTSGNYWIASGSTPRAAETMTAGAFAIPFHVGSNVGSCQANAALAALHAGGFARTEVLDGFLAARAIASQRRQRGMSIAFASLLVGAIVEAILILRAARHGSKTSNVRATWLTSTPAAIAIGIGMSLLGFALLAAFIATH